MNQKDTKERVGPVGERIWKEGDKTKILANQQPMGHEPSNPRYAAATPKPQS